MVGVSTDSVHCSAPNSANRLSMVRRVSGDHISTIAAANVEATTRAVIEVLREKHSGNDSSPTQRTSDYVTALPIGHRGEHVENVQTH